MKPATGGHEPQTRSIASQLRRGSTFETWLGSLRLLRRHFLVPVNVIVHSPNPKAMEAECPRHVAVAAAEAAASSDAAAASSDAAPAALDAEVAPAASQAMRVTCHWNCCGLSG